MRNNDDPIPDHRSHSELDWTVEVELDEVLVDIIEKEGIIKGEKIA